MAGTMMNPPPTPMMAASRPTSAPIRIGGTALMYSFDLLNLCLNGSRWIQLCCPGRRTETGWPLAALRRLPRLSISIRPPMMPRKKT